MKRCLFFIVLTNSLLTASLAQTSGTEESRGHIRGVVETYTKARTEKDTALLNTILTDDIDQLVSSGTWRKGREKALEGMMQSSENNPGSRTITVEAIRFLTADCAVADARYIIVNPDGSERKMWSTFLLVRSGTLWKIAGIRNMLPAGSGN